MIAGEERQGKSENPLPPDSAAVCSELGSLNVLDEAADEESHLVRRDTLEQTLHRVTPDPNPLEEELGDGEQRGGIGAGLRQSTPERPSHGGPHQGPPLLLRDAEVRPRGTELHRLLDVHPLNERERALRGPPDALDRGLRLHQNLVRNHG